MEIIRHSAERIELPESFAFIDEGEYGIATYSPTTQFIVTDGLLSCKAVSLYHEPTQTGLLSHFIIGRQNIGKIMSGLVNKMGDINTNDLVAHIAVGETKHDMKPSLEQLINALIKIRPAKLLVDDNYGHEKHLALNLLTGNLSELNRSSGIRPHSFDPRNIGTDLFYLEAK